MNKVQPLRSFRTRFPIEHVALSSRGKLLAAAGIKTVGPAMTEAFVTVWAFDADKPMLKLRRPGFEVRVGFSPDGKRLALIAHGFELLDLESGNELVRIHSPSAAIREWAFSPDGKLVAVGAENGQICVVNLRKYSPEPQLKLKARQFRLAFTPDGRSLAVTTRSQGRGVVTLYSLLSMQPNRLVVECLKTITLQKKPRRLAHKVLVAIHRLDERGGVRLFEAHDGVPGGIAGDPRLNLLATASATQVKLWDLAALLENDC